jgi:hypothetical protein
VPRRKDKGFGEAQAPFAPVGLNLASIFDAYGFACAFTGADLRREAAADPLGWLLRAGPADSDLVPATTDAIYAYERGHLALGPRYNFLVDLEKISPEFLEQLNAIGRLTVPRLRRLRPSLDAIKVHRDAFAAGRLR